MEIQVNRFREREREKLCAPFVSVDVGRTM